MWSGPTSVHLYSSSAYTPLPASRACGSRRAGALFSEAAEVCSVLGAAMLVALDRRRLCGSQWRVVVGSEVDQ